MATKTVEVKDPRTEIADYLKDKGIKQTWLADKINMSDTHLHFLLKCERDLTEDNRAKINLILGTQF